jgi:trimeric autotransporter adhesin
MKERFVAVLAMAGACVLATAATAWTPAAQALNSIPTETAVTNGTVNAVVPTPSAIYIGGEFTQVGPLTGPGVGIDSATAISTGLPEVSGGGQQVRVATSDGSGGFYIGGQFARVGGLDRRNLAHILADGSVDPGFAPTPGLGAVGALAVSGSTLYVGGAFTHIGGKARSNIAALDRTTGAATSWNPSAENEVDALAVSGSTVYIGGGFTSVGGKARNHIAAIDGTTGAPTSWNPNPQGHVNALAFSGSTVYAGGDFHHIGGESRSIVAALDPITGAATSWNPNPTYRKGTVHALAVSGSTVYVGGTFAAIGGAARKNLAALSRTTGMATGWNPSADSHVYALAVSGSTVYAGGDFHRIHGEPRNGLAAIDATTGTATNWKPNVSRPGWNPLDHGGIYALAVSGSTVYVGGSFTSIGAKVRHGVAALDPATGAVTSWNPNAAGTVDALRASGSTVYAGGDFITIGGQARSNIAALDRSSGAATSWNPSATSTGCCGAIHALDVSGSTVYAGGRFDHIGGQVRSNIAAIDRTTGAPTSWDPNATGAVDALRVSGSTVYAGGSFAPLPPYIAESIGGQSRYYIAALDANTGNATSWDPNAGGTVAALAVSGSTVYAGGGFSSIGGKTRHKLAAIDAATGTATSWNPSANGRVIDSDGEVDGFALFGSTVFVGGDFTSIGGKARIGLAALDRATGAARRWNPIPMLGQYEYGQVRALAIGTDGSLWAGGSFTGFDSAPLQSGIARFEP